MFIVKSSKNICVPNKVARLNVKVFNFVSGVNKARFIVATINMSWMKVGLNQSKNGSMLNVAVSVKH